MHPFILSLTLGLALTAGCAATEQQAADRPADQPRAAANAPYQNVSVEEARRLVEANPGLTVLDVREPHEFAEGHVPGARNLPLGQLDTWAPTLDATKPYLVVCRSGARSAQASAQLAERQFKGITNMTGGMLDWQGRNYPTER
ncbi:MAG: rhodanese-like domain-containing protein [Candidatus Sericytochromatia bacterium]